AMIERGEGRVSADLAERWFADRPEHTSVVRTEEGIVGFAYHIFCPSGSPMEERDPVVRAILDHVARTAPLRPGERVEVARCFGRRWTAPGSASPCGPRSSTSTIRSG